MTATITAGHTAAAHFERLGQSFDRPSRYAQAVGQAVRELLFRQEGLTLTATDKRLGLAPGTSTLIANGWIGGVVDADHWHQLLWLCGAKAVKSSVGDFTTVEEAANGRLLGQLLLLAAFRPNFKADLESTVRFEFLLEEVGLTWATLETAIGQWSKGEFCPASTKLLARALRVNVNKEEEGDAFCDLRREWEAFVGYDDSDCGDEDPEPVN